MNEKINAAIEKIGTYQTGLKSRGPERANAIMRDHGPLILAALRDRLELPKLIEAAYKEGYMDRHGPVGTKRPAYGAEELANDLQEAWEGSRAWAALQKEME